jgi:hypothetical protein
VLRECQGCGDPLYDYMTRCARCGKENPWNDPESEDAWGPPPAGPAAEIQRRRARRGAIVGVFAVALGALGLLGGAYEQWRQTGYPSRFFLPALAVLIALIVLASMSLWSVIEERNAGGSRRPRR